MHSQPTFKLPPKFFFAVIILVLVSLGCQALSGIGQQDTPTPNPETSAASPSPAATRTVPPTEPATLSTPEQTDELATSEPAGVLIDGQPVKISGTIEYTSPFFLNSISEPFVLLEDQAGFAARDREFIFTPASQTIGAVELVDSGTLRYSLALPIQPQGTWLDVDNDQEDDLGVQVFAIAYWSNTWGDPFLEPRDGQGWSTAYASTIVDPENEDEIMGGKLVIWAPDEQQSFPSGFGPDNRLFTTDDPIMDVPAGYSVIDLDAEPFVLTREEEPQIELYEGVVAVNDYSDLSYSEAFANLFAKASREYPFTEEKGIDWQALQAAYEPQFEQVDDDLGFYELMREFLAEIPDGHVGITLDSQVFFEQAGGSFGMTLAELSDGRVIVNQVLPGLPADEAGIEAGAEIAQWNGQPIAQAIAEVQPFFGPYSTLQSLRQDQLVFLTRVAPESSASLTYQNPGSTGVEEIDLESVIDYQSLFLSLPDFTQDELALPLESEVLDDSGLGYIRINTFSDDYNLMARLWERAIQQLITLEIPGLILDLRVNGGGNSGLARDFAGYFYEEELELYRRSYFNESTGAFEELDPGFSISPAPDYYPGRVAILVSPDCVSACEGFVYAMTRDEDVFVVGHQATAGAFGEVGRGQYTLPGDYNVQFPTGRSETPEGELLLEGSGVTPDIVVPVTYASVMENQDAVLDTAVLELLARINDQD